jgi:hypothetical protein
MRYRPINQDPEDPRLDRFIPDDFEHVAKYPLSALEPEAQPDRVPVVIGVNWYSEMDGPEKDESLGEYFIAPGGADTMTTIRGGHCVCLEPGEAPQDHSWAEFYDQGREGACVGFGWSRCMSLLNGELYAARWLWDRAKESDEWDETNPGDDNGTSVRAAGEVLAAAGHVDWEGDYADDDYTARGDYQPNTADGINAYRWALSVDEVHAVLQNPRADELGAVPILNSWGMEYPYRVWLPDDVLDRLISEEGEIAVPTDR